MATTGTQGENSKKKKLKSKVKSAMDETLSKVNAVNTLLNNFPTLYQTTYDYTTNGVNDCISFNFFLNLLKILGITQEEILELFKNITCNEKFLGGLETAVKALLISNFKNLFSCNASPLIPDKLMDPNYGIEFKLSLIDLYNLLKKDPTNEKTSIYYFDTDGYNVNTIQKSCDFNAFLYYITHKGAEFAHSWDNRIDYYDEFKNGNDGLKKAFFSASDNGYFEYEKKKYEKKTFIHCQYKELTLNNLSGNNTIKIWIDPGRYKQTRAIIKKDSIEMKPFNIIKGPQGDTGTQGDTGSTGTQAWGMIKNRLTNDAYELQKDVNTIYAGAVSHLNTGISLNKTIFEFNYDFVNSIKLFDSKALVASILNSLLEFSSKLNVELKFNISPEENVITQMVTYYVNKVLNEDELDGVSDDYFAFSNEEYEEMLERAVLKQSGEFNLSDNDETYTLRSENSIISAISRIGKATTDEERGDSLADALEEITEEITTTENSINIDYSINDGKWYNIFNLIEVCLKETLTKIVFQALSPKVYMLYLINSIVMGDIEYIWDKSEKSGDNITFKNKEDFVRNLKNLLNNITKEIKELILKELYNRVIKYVKEMVKQYALLLVKEKISDYKALLANLLSLMGTGSALTAYKDTMATVNNVKSLLKKYAGSKYTNLMVDNVTYMDMVPEQTKPNS